MTGLNNEPITSEPKDNVHDLQDHSRRRRPAVLSAGAMAVSTSAADAHYAGSYQTYCKTFYHTVLVGYDDY
ncbi:MAG TPA: hypothetical protein VKQ27_10660, partial [Acetobacteraceae bacterium]|nr:hypothetical protein [Acetobacteraceae bacterium]